MRRIIKLFIISSSLFSIAAYATGLPVFDASAFTQSLLMVKNTFSLIKQAENQLNVLDDLSKINTNQFNLLEKNLSGNFGYGKLFNKDDDLYKRQWSQSSWENVLSASSSGHSSAFTEAERKYEKLYPVEADDKVYRTRSRENLSRTHYRQSREISRAALAASSYSYNQINEHIQNVHDILKKLEDEKSEKAAIDINTRLVAELAFIQIEMLRQQDIRNQLVATQTQGEVNGVSDQSKFMQWK